MTMMITKFNRMIRNKWLWAIIAVVIVISFVGVSTQSGGCDAEQNRRSMAGSLFGVDLPMREFYLGRFFEMGLRDNVSLSPESNDIVQEKTWKRLAALRTADRMGISTSNEEIQESLKRDPTFAVNGVFSAAKYKALLVNQLRIAPEMYETFLRQEITLKKLAGVLESAVWVSPVEMNRRVDNLTALFVVEYAEMTQTGIVESVEVTEDDAKEFFAKNVELFRIPEKINVRYVQFPIADHLAGVTIEDDDVREYYDAHSEDYATTGTNGESAFIPLDDVRADIAGMLTTNEAMLKAKDIATDFVMELAPDRSGRSLSMETVAASSKMAVYTSAFFSAWSEIPGIEAGRDFNKAAFALEEDDPETSFSDAIVGTENVYVIACNQGQESRLPEFDEVKESVTPLARRALEQKAFAEKTDEIRAAAELALGEGKTFASAMSTHGLNVTTTAQFSVYDSFAEESEHPRELAGGVMAGIEGELTDVLRTADGALLAHITAKLPGDLASSELLKPELLAMLDRYRAGFLFEDWKTHNLAAADREDLMKPAEVEEPTEQPQKGTRTLPPASLPGRS